MIIRGEKISFKKLFCLLVYYSILRYLPASYSMIGGLVSKKLRYLCCKQIFKSCGSDVNIEKRANFGSGLNLSIGNNSGIGLNCQIPSDIKIGHYVMMGPNCTIFSHNHTFTRTDRPMIQQGISERMQTIIEDDVWIGGNVIMTPGRIIKQGTIIGAGCVLTKDFPEYSIVAGNPGRLIRSRMS